MVHIYIIMNIGCVFYVIENVGCVLTGKHNYRIDLPATVIPA